MSRTLIFGDVHGCSSELRSLVSAFAPQPGDRLVSVGDLIRKGPDSVDVVRFLRSCAASGVTVEHVLGNHEAYVRQYARAEMAVVPSVYEGFGLPAGEAMACGVPVISTTGGALPEVVGDAGLLVAPADPAALAHAIRTLHDCPGMAAALGAAGRQRVLARFTWSRAAEQTAAVYREVIDEHRRI